MNFFDHHGTVALFFLTFFPRLALLFGSFAKGGLLWWLGWIFAPHFLVAILALPYWTANPILVGIAWLVALGGTGGEAKAAQKSRTFVLKR